ncbi:MAG: hypothetical protein H6557_03725 [Lewinellaceae bacterium]|nr:hypothetical protein [Phaeodactylibacter sp.]MCB9035707.1 hypothetical protein [Lewinellaceae bacterium]
MDGYIVGWLPGRLAPRLAGRNGYWAAMFFAADGEQIKIFNRLVKTVANQKSKIKNPPPPLPLQQKKNQTK